jgi:hypothetical protein
MRLLLFGLLLLSTPVQSQNTPVADNHPGAPQSGQQPAPYTVSQPGIAPQKGNQAPENQGGTNSKSPSNTVYLILTGVIAFATICQAVIAWRQGKIYEKQYTVMSEALVASNTSAEAAAKGILALEKLERPFLMVELRKQEEIWLVNVGRIPAQIIWHNPCGTLIFPDADFKELPDDYNYGMGYYDEGSEVFNVEWMAPKTERQLCYFDWLSTQGAISDEMMKELNSFRKVLLFLSAVKYRGMLSETVYESRWCYKWLGAKNGLRLGGPYGYNKYT